MRLIEDLLDTARISSGKLHLELASVDLRPIIDASVDVARAGADAKRIRIAVAVNAEHCVVRGDAERLQQVLGNLLGNAIKFTPEGGNVTVDLGCDGEHATIVVADSGVGIAPEQLPHIFEPFQQAGESSVRQGGLGLGLAISRHLIELHGGTIRAESSGDGAGARFTITLPIDTSADTEASATGGLASAR